MPKVSDEYKTRRRQGILDAAQRCFARHGYEGTTLVRLEEETGLTRGGIFHYFENKQALFVAVAATSSERLVRIWAEEGYRALLEAVAHEDPEWLAVQIEAMSLVRKDAALQRALDASARTSADATRERLERLRDLVRSDVPLEQIAMFLSLVANGLGVRRLSGDPPPDIDALVELVETGVGPHRSGRGTGMKTR